MSSPLVRMTPRQRRRYTKKSTEAALTRQANYAQQLQMSRLRRAMRRLPVDTARGR